MNSYSKQSKAGQAGSWLQALLALTFVTLMLLASGAARAATETITYIHPDISGSPLAATNDAGALVWRESYRAYGQRQVNAPASAQHSQWFHGKEQDAGTGLQYFGARYYDPAVGRFLGMDPVDYQDGNAHSFNRYAYGNNNPVRYLDPDGRFGVLTLGVAAAGTILIAGATTTPEQRALMVRSAYQAGQRLSDALGQVSNWVFSEGANTAPPEVTDKIPPEWGEGEANRKGDGTRWQDPKDKGSGVRVDAGNPNNSQPSQQVDHVVVRDKGVVIGRDGNPINGSIKQDPTNAHIPLSEYKNWRQWNKP